MAKKKDVPEKIIICRGQTVSKYQLKRNLIYRRRKKFVEKICGIILENDLKLAIAIIKYAFRKNLKRNVLWVFQLKELFRKTGTKNGKCAEKLIETIQEEIKEDIGK